MYTGPNIEQGELVFGYDTGFSHGITRSGKRYFPGPPVFNYVPANIAAASGVSTSGGAPSGNWSSFGYHSGYGIIRHGIEEKDGRPNTMHVEWPDGMTSAGDCYPTINLIDSNNNIVTTNGGEVFYLQFEWKSEGSEFLTSGNDDWSVSTFYGNGWKTGTHMSAEVISNQRIPGRGKWYKKIIKYTAANVTGQIPLLRFSAGYKMTSGGSYHLWVDNISITRNYPARYWVPGKTLRDTTTALIDIKKTSTINATNTSFDSKGQPFFDGTDDFLDTGYDLSWNNTNSVSIEFIIKPLVINGANKPVLGKKYPNWEWFIGFIDNEIRLVYWNSSGGHTNGMDFSSSPAFTSTSSYYHVVYTWDRARSRFYINGQLDTTHTATNPSINQNRTNNVMVGGNIYSWTDGYASCNVPVVRMYSRELNAQEIKQHYRGYKKRFNL